jgi:ATP-dependent RNA circularization protein (DNA/RNA ligase family)
MAAREDILGEALFPDLMLFGEWCYARHSLYYTRLPDWFLAFDVYDRSLGAFWSAERRDKLVQTLGLALVPCLARGRFDLVSLRAYLGASKLADGPSEGLIIRRDRSEVLVGRAKLVRPAFVQGIQEHWSRNRIEPNKLSQWAP